MAAASAWTEDRVKLLVELAREGLSSTQIGRQLAVTRNAVIGKLARLGERCRANDGHRKSPKPPKPKKPPRRVAPFERTPDELKSPGTIPVTPAPAGMPPARALGHAALAALEPGDCRWPIGDPRTPAFRFCGAACESGQFYCLHHRVRSVSKDWR